MASAERAVDAPADTVYQSVEDMRNHHPRFLVPAADEVGKVVGGKRWDKSVAHKALNLIGKARTVVSIAISGLDVPAVHNDLNAIIKDLKKAHNNKQDPVVQRDLKRLEADTNRLRDSLVSIVPGLEFIFPPPAS